ncbi:hypothetical protein Lbru_0691 [Legionella brunensis]|uniref:DUF2490 domain-containing protein n=2 Tax=Legionella brunensis TaxID=29422 RepID=A0A0W0STR6_9GAMM|nr:hypothetical protein Lbru_0691 [Legionella brunensis]
MPKQLWAIQTVERVWSTLGLNTQIGKFSYQLEPQLRVIDQPNLFDQFLTNFSGGYQFSPQWNIALGTTSVTTAQNPGFSPSTQEMRLWQQVTYTQKHFPGFMIRSRIEERKRLDASAIGYRLRERITLKKKLTDSLSLVGFEEFFININQPNWLPTQTVDQNRILISLDQAASKTLTVGAGYLYQYIFSNPRQASHVISLYAQITLPNEPN